MYKKKCPVCGSSHTMKNGTRNHIQLYVCRECRHQFRKRTVPTLSEIWRAYLEKKQTVRELSEHFGISVSTVKRRLNEIRLEWEQPPLRGGGFIHLDVTFWGRGFGVLVALDAVSGQVLYIAFVTSETVKAYEAAIQSITERGYRIDGIIIDGKKSLFKSFADYHIQMCQFHMKQIIKRYLTQNPKLLAARALNELMAKLTKSDGVAFQKEFNAWKEQWHDTISRQSVYKDGSIHYTHRRLRSAMNSLNCYMPYLFTYQREDCKGMPNTNNKIEGTFTDLKKNLNNHSGMTMENRKRFIVGFFLALNSELQL